MAIGDLIGKSAELAGAGINKVWGVASKLFTVPAKGTWNMSKSLLNNPNAVVKWGSRGAAAVAAVAVGKSIFSKSGERVEQIPPEMIAQQNQLAANQELINTMEQNAQAQAVADAPLIAAAQNIQAQQETQLAQQQAQEAQAQKAMQTANTPESTNQIAEMLSNMPAEPANNPDYQVSNMQPHGAVSKGEQLAVNA